VAPTSQIQSEKQAALNTESRRNLTEAFSFGDCDKSQFAQPLTKACRRVERHARTGIAHALAAVTAPSVALPPQRGARPQKVRFCITILRAIVMPAASRAAVRAKVTLFCQVICV
jgi:hypothetical protein